uniref:Sphingomyelin phosphodiesterase C-terminal domain-containing protein n=1 Tax=Panagrolaimus sp. JU765 TaxID=591449 RepID=A0AC34RRA7_9BILA
MENKFVHIVSHIAPGVFERTPNFTWMPDFYNRKFLDLTVKYSTTIKWMIFGHHHTDTFHIVKNSNNEPVQLMLMAPSVTPWFSDLDGAGANNPAFRIIDYDPKTWEFNDIETYYIELDQLNKNPNTNWTLEYTFKNAYNLKTINAKTMNNLLENFKTNDTAFLQYIEYNSVKWKPQLPKGKFRS